MSSVGVVTMSIVLRVGHLLADHAPHQLGDLHQRQVLVADVEVSFCTLSAGAVSNSSTASQ